VDPVKVVELMENEAMKRKAPVYHLKAEIKTPFQHLVAALLSSRTRDEQLSGQPRICSRGLKARKTFCGWVRMR